MSALIGGLGASAFLGLSGSNFDKLAETFDAKDQCVNPGFAVEIIFVSIALLIACVGVFGFAMRQVSIFSSGRPLSRTMACWQEFAFHEIEKLERDVTFAGWLFAVAVVLLIFAVFLSAYCF